MSIFDYLHDYFIAADKAFIHIHERKAIHLY
jgi:hypothetical protein